MRLLRRQLVLILLLATAALAQTPQLKEAEFQSKSLGRPMKYRVLLPASYAQGDKKYPVLYLLHGLYGDYTNWTKLTKLQTYADGLELVIAMPDGNDSWYTNWATDPQQKYEDYIVHDFLSEIETQYRVTGTRDTRFIAGLSMGGYGAIKFALKNPQLFSLVGSFSGALNAPNELNQERPEFAAQLNKVYGSDTSKTRAENDIYQLVKSANPAAVPYFFLSCGTADYFLQPNRQFVLALPSLKIAYEYHELPGKHDWAFWDHSINVFLRDMVAPKLK
jgi:S-formylglutathione hydrolase FrmB